MPMPKVTFICAKHDCALQGETSLLAEVKADVDRSLSLIDGEGNERTGNYLYVLPARRGSARVRTLGTPEL